MSLAPLNRAEINDQDNDHQYKVPWHDRGETGTTRLINSIGRAIHCLTVLDSERLAATKFYNQCPKTLKAIVNPRSVNFVLSDCYYDLEQTATPEGSELSEQKSPTEIDDDQMVAEADVT